MQLSEILDRLAAAVFPRRCLQCSDVIEYDRFLCAKCRLVRVGRVTLPFPNRLSDVASVCVYGDESRPLILKIKDASEPRVYTFFAGEMHRLLTQLWPDASFDLIVPVPTTQAKMEARGFNQADLLAEPLSKLLGIPTYPHALLREAHSREQHTLSSEQRRENAGLSYKINQPDEVCGKTVLLLDDLLTTGYTASACANCLLDAGAAKVYALTCAATPLASR